MQLFILPISTPYIYNSYILLGYSEMNAISTLFDVMCILIRILCTCCLFVLARKV